MFYCVLKSAQAVLVYFRAVHHWINVQDAGSSNSTNERSDARPWRDGVVGERCLLLNFCSRPRRFTINHLTKCNGTRWQPSHVSLSFSWPLIKKTRVLIDFGQKKGTSSVIVADQIPSATFPPHLQTFQTILWWLRHTRPYRKTFSGTFRNARSEGKVMQQQSLTSRRLMERLLIQATWIMLRFMARWAKLQCTVQKR